MMVSLRIVNIILLTQFETFLKDIFTTRPLNICYFEVILLQGRTKSDYMLHLFLLLSLLPVALLLLFTKRILSIHNDLPQGTLPLCLNVKLKCLCSGKKHVDPVHL